MVAVVSPTPVFAANMGQSLPHASEMALALLTNGKPLGTQSPVWHGSEPPPAAEVLFVPALPPEFAAPPTLVAPPKLDAPAALLVLLPSEPQAASRLKPASTESVVTCLAI